MKPEHYVAVVAVILVGQLVLIFSSFSGAYHPELFSSGCEMSSGFEVCEAQASSPAGSVSDFVVFTAMLFALALSAGLGWLGYVSSVWGKHHG